MRILVLGFITSILCSLAHSQCTQSTGEIMVIQNERVPSLGGSATFYCAKPRAMMISSSDFVDNVEWLINGSVLDINLPNNITSDQFGLTDLVMLTFTSIPMEYNNTQIRCRVQMFTSCPIRLLLQGPLDLSSSTIMSEQNNSFFSFSWDPPFTLNSEDESISYCVKVINSTSNSTLREFNTTDTEISYPLPHKSWCDVYCFFVFPKNNAGKGISVKVFSQNQSSPPSQEQLKDLQAILIIVMSAPVCNADVIFVDVFTGENITLRGNEINISENNITLTTERLVHDRVYNSTLTAYNNAGLATSSFITSTHDIRNFTIQCHETNGIEVTTLYSEHSDASGALFSFVFITDSGDVDFGRSLLLALDRNTSHNYTLPFDLYPGHYRVYVYDIEHDGTLSSGVGYPAARDELVPSGEGLPGSGSSFFEDCQTNASSGVIHAQCILLNGSMATGIQVVAQLSNASEVHKLYVNQSTDLQTPVTVPVERAGVYQVSIFAIRGGMGILDLNDIVQHAELVMVMMMPTTPTVMAQTAGSSQESPLIAIAVGAIVAGLIIVIVIVVGVLAIVVCCYRKKQYELPRPSTTSGSSEQAGGSRGRMENPEQCSVDVVSTTSEERSVERMEMEPYSLHRPSTTSGSSEQAGEAGGRMEQASERETTV